ncbi:MAG: alpha/beta fold hydrolase [Chthoniobacterales bacterium]
MRLHFEVSGSGPIPLLCIHGWCCESSQFDALAGDLDSEFRIFRPDLPGHGKTPLDGFQPAFANYAAAVVEFAIEHNIENAVLLGHSMGGALTLMAAASGRLHPRALINLDGSLPAAPHVLAGLQKLREWLDEPDFRDRLAAALREGFFLPHERDTRCEAIIRTMCSAPDAVLRFLPEQIGGLDAATVLSKISAPVLYIGADTPRFDAARATTLLPPINIERIAGAGHFMHIYETQRIAALMGSFIAAQRNSD